MKKKDREEERVEKIIRGLLKLPENRRCINCNSLGPQYVCTTFFTFVCTNCSGIHREFTHRVKSVSMAKFNADEVSSLQAGGNERARQIYFKDWDAQCNQYPDSNNLHKLREFIKHVYVDRKYTGERSQEKLPGLRVIDKEETYDNRRVSLCSGRSRSPNYEDRNEQSERSGLGGRRDDKNFKYYYDERRSPRYSQETSRYGGFKKATARFEVVDDRFRDDGPRSGRQSDGHRISRGESRYGRRSPQLQKYTGQSNLGPPVVRQLKDILAENIPPLEVGEHSKETKMKEEDDSAPNQMTSSSRNTESSSGNVMQKKSHSSESLVDLNADSKPSDAVAVPITKDELLSSEGGNQFSHYSTAKATSRPPAPKANTLEFLLMELTVPSVIPADNPSGVLTSENPSSCTSGCNMLMSDDAATAGPLGQLLALPSSGLASPTLSGGDMPAGSVSSVVPVGEMLTLPNSAGASTIASGGKMPVGSVSSPAPAVQMSTASGGSTPAGDTVSAAAVGETLSLLDAFDASTVPSATNLPKQPSVEGPPQAALDISGDLTSNMSNGPQVSGMQQQQPSALPADSSCIGQQTCCAPVGTINKELWTPSDVPSAPGPSTALGENLSEDVSKPAQDSNSEVKSQSLPSESKSSGRKEIPMDLFTSTYTPVPGPIPGWQTGPPYGMGFNMQYYPNTMQVSYPNLAKSTNPFELNIEATLAKAPQFPSMGNLHGALPGVPDPGIMLHTSSTGSNSSLSMPAHSTSYASAMPALSPFSASAMPSGVNMWHQAHNHLPPSRPQAAGGFGSEGDPFGSLHMNQQLTSGYLPPNSSNALPSAGGNPFG